MSPWLGSGGGRARSPGVAQRPTGARLSGAPDRTTCLPGERQLARLVKQLSRLWRGEYRADRAGAAHCDAAARDGAVDRGSSPVLAPAACYRRRPPDQKCRI